MVEMQKTVVRLKIQYLRQINDPALQPNIEQYCSRFYSDNLLN